MLIGVSGGVDSMVLLDIFIKLKFNVLVAHVNFHQRGMESDLDQKLVEDRCHELNIPLMVKHFPNEKPKGNFQEAARKFRYDFFSELLILKECQKIAVAHHAGDLMETQLMQWLRTGNFEEGKGLPYQRETVIRPLFWFSREEILNYAIANQILFREDASNNSDQYERNKVRHHLANPILNFFPGFDKRLAERALIQQARFQFVQNALSASYENIIKKKGMTVYINREELLAISGWEFFLDYFLEKYDMAYATRIQVILSVKQPNGQNFSWKDKQLHVLKENITIQNAPQKNDNF